MPAPPPPTGGGGPLFLWLALWFAMPALAAPLDDVREGWLALEAGEIEVAATLASDAIGDATTPEERFEGHHLAAHAALRDEAFGVAMTRFDAAFEAVPGARRTSLARMPAITAARQRDWATARAWTDGIDRDALDDLGALGVEILAAAWDVAERRPGATRRADRLLDRIPEGAGDWERGLIAWATVEALAAESEDAELVGPTARLARQLATRRDRLARAATAIEPLLTGADAWFLVDALHRVGLAWEDLAGALLWIPPADVPPDGRDVYDARIRTVAAEAFHEALRGHELADDAARRLAPTLHLRDTVTADRAMVAALLDRIDDGRLGPRHTVPDR